MTDQGLEAFQAKLAELSILKDQYNDSGNAFNEELRATIEKCYRKLYPRRRYSYEKACDLPEAKKIVEEWRVRVDAYIKQYLADEDRIESELCAIAPNVILPLTNDMLPYDSRNSASYATQGYGADTYARHAVEMMANKARMYDVKAEVRHEPHPTVKNFYTFVLYLNVSPIGWQVLRRLPDVPLKQVLKTMKEKAINPRVYMPSLPWDIEEKLGL